MFEGGTRFGYHFIGEYKTCPRRWLLHYGYGLERKTKVPQLIYGSAIHTYIEEFYRENPKAHDEALLILEPLKETDSDEYVDRVHKLEAAEKALEPFLLADLENWTVQPEIEIERPIFGKLDFTMKIDALCQNKETGVYLLREHKTTGYSVEAMKQKVFLDDQATAYLWGIAAINIPKPIGVDVQVIYQKGQVTKIARECIYRSNDEVETFAAETGAWFSRAIKAFKNWCGGDDETFCFPSNRDQCDNYCPYATICRSIRRDAPAPEGFEKGVWPHAKEFLNA